MHSIRDIKMAISSELYNEFGEAYKIYTEDISPDINPPSFWVRDIKTSVAQIIANRYYKQCSFVINFFPVEDGGTEIQQCNDVADRLFNTLEYIKQGEQILRGTNMSSEVADKVLSFIVNYNFTIIKEKIPAVKMETLEEKTYLK